MKKTYNITSPWHNNWEATIAIDEEKVIHQSEDTTFATKDAIKEMVEFWSGWEDKLRNNDGDYTKTFIQQLASNMYVFDVANYGLSIAGMISQFDDLEGWCKMDGSYGIEIIGFEEVQIDDDDFFVEEMQDGNNA